MEDNVLTEFSEEWRTEVQEVLYAVLEEWVFEARESLVVLREARQVLSRATIYGSYLDVVRLMERMESAVARATEAVLKVSGGLDSPAQVSLAVSQMGGHSRTWLGGLDAASKVRVVELLSDVLKRVDGGRVVNAGPVETREIEGEGGGGPKGGRRKAARRRTPGRGKRPS